MTVTSLTHLLDNYDDDDDDDDVDDDDPQLLIKFLAGAKWRLVSQSGSHPVMSHIFYSQVNS